MVNGLQVIHEKSISCEDCIIGKHKRDNFPCSTYRSKKHLEIVHTDLCGSIQSQSIGGIFYFLTFIYDFSKKIWIYFIKKKSEMFSRFKDFKALTQRNSGKFMKVLRSNGEGEYDSNDFSYFYKKHGIQRNFATRYTPRQNGVVK